jgi:hypothetical protein
MKGEKMITGSCHTTIPWDSELAFLEKVQMAKVKAKDKNAEKKEVSWLLGMLIVISCFPAIMCWLCELRGLKAKPRTRTA